ncbi:DUF4023 family protein [Brevibacillus dissolubilis]|nr:DUF4023 family protein [Brevibacillus dissolubilis]
MESTEKFVDKIQDWQAQDKKNKQHQGSGNQSHALPSKGK